MSNHTASDPKDCPLPLDFFLNRNRQNPRNDHEQN